MKLGIQGRFRVSHQLFAKVEKEISQVTMSVFFTIMAQKNTRITTTLTTLLEMPKPTLPKTLQIPCVTGPRNVETEYDPQKVSAEHRLGMTAAAPAPPPGGYTFLGFTVITFTPTPNPLKAMTFIITRHTDSC